ncbi:hypothetical protein GCM10010417_54230 [Streptomyces carpaticus]
MGPTPPPSAARPRGRATRHWTEPALTGMTGVCLVAGAVAWWSGARSVADLVWSAGTVAGLVPAVVWVARAVRHGRTGVDLIAVLALGGSLAVREYLAGALIALMLATGRWLESAAERRGTRDRRLWAGRGTAWSAGGESGAHQQGSLFRGACLVRGCTPP